MRERVLNFLNNWVDANIRHASHDPDADASTMQYRYLTDAVAAGLSTEEVNAEWPEAEIEIRGHLTSVAPGPVVTLARKNRLAVVSVQTSPWGSVI